MFVCDVCTNVRMYKHTNLQMCACMNMLHVGSDNDSDSNSESEGDAKPGPAPDPDPGRSGAEAVDFMDSQRGPPPQPRWPPVAGKAPPKVRRPPAARPPPRGAPAARAVRPGPVSRPAATRTPRTPCRIAMKMPVAIYRSSCILVVHGVSQSHRAGTSREVQAGITTTVRCE